MTEDIETSSTQPARAAPGAADTPIPLQARIEALVRRASGSGGGRCFRRRPSGRPDPEAPCPLKTANPRTSSNAVTEVSDRVSNLVREEIELAKAEVTMKAKSLAPGRRWRSLAGAVFGVFAVCSCWLEAIAWALNAVFVPGAGSIWDGFLIVFGLLAMLTIASFGFAWTQAEGRGAPGADDGDRRGQADPRDRDVQDGDRIANGRRAHTGADPRLDRAEPPAARARRSTSSASR